VGCLLFMVPDSFVWYVMMILKAEPLLVDGALSLRDKVLEVFFLLRHWYGISRRWIYKSVLKQQRDAMCGLR
jgi:hypothetical protein